MFDLQKLIKPHANTATIAGLFMIIVPMWLFDDTSPFPGLRALPPTLGTLLLLCSQHPVLNTVLSTRGLQWLGLGSYSLYLFHWPLMAYLRLFRVEFTGFRAVAIILGALNLAYLSYTLVETPTREAKMSNRSIYTWLFVVPCLLIFVFALSASQFGGVASSNIIGNTDQIDHDAVQGFSLYLQNCASI